MLTFVFRVRLCTSPLFSTRSNTKLPFWLTGEKVSRFRCPLRIPGVVSFGDIVEESGGSLMSTGFATSLGSTSAIVYGGVTMREYS